MLRIDGGAPEADPGWKTPPGGDREGTTHDDTASRVACCRAGRGARGPDARAQSSGAAAPRRLRGDGAAAVGVQRAGPIATGRDDRRAGADEPTEARRHRR